MQSSVFDLSLKKTNPFAENFEAVNKHNLSVEKDAEKAQLSTEQNTKKDDLLAEKDAIIADLKQAVINLHEGHKDIVNKLKVEYFILSTIFTCIIYIYIYT